MRCTKCGLKSNYANLKNGIAICPECGAVMIGNASQLVSAQSTSIDIRVSNRNGCLNLIFPQPVIEVEIEPEMAEKFLRVLQDIVRSFRQKEEGEGSEENRI